jgi:hypothetical protein
MRKKPYSSKQLDRISKAHDPHQVNFFTHRNPEPPKAPEWKDKKILRPRVPL